jgi:hypothetical protein
MLAVRQKANEKLFFVLLVSLIAARQNGARRERHEAGRSRFSGIDVRYSDSPKLPKSYSTVTPAAAPAALAPERALAREFV